MMKELRKRAVEIGPDWSDCSLLNSAADEIERLRTDAARYNRAIEAEVHEELRKQEPVAWIHPLYKESGFKLVGITRWSDDCLPLYAAPIPPTVPDTNLETATNRNYLESIGQLPPTEGSKP